MKIGDKVTNPGELRTRIVLEERVKAQDAGGFPQPMPGRTIAVWCRWINAHGDEAWRAGALGARQTATVLIRYQPDIDTTWRIRHRGGMWEIHSIDNIRERDEYQELRVFQVAAG